MFGFVRGVRGRAVVVVLVAAGLLGGVTASSVTAANSTTVTWNVSSLSAGQVKSLSAIASTNSSGVQTWTKTGSCVLSLKSNPPKLTMGTGASCTLTLTIKRSGNYPAKTSSKTIQRKPYRVGQAGPGGGIIFYVDLTRAAGSQYFEAACAGWSDGTCGGSDLTDPEIVWCGRVTPISGADGRDIGTGEQNTTDIVAGCTTAVTAAKVAKALVLGGKSDWFLPSLYELNQMYIRRTAIGDLLTGDWDYYWSSSEDAPDDAWIHGFSILGDMTEIEQTRPEYVRPIRSF